MCVFIVNSENALFTVNVYDVCKLCSDDYSDECCTLLPTRVHVSPTGVRVSARVCVSPRVRASPHEWQCVGVSPHAHTSARLPASLPGGGGSPHERVSPQECHISPRRSHLSPRESSSISPRKVHRDRPPAMFPFCARGAGTRELLSACQRLASRVDGPRLGLRAAASLVELWWLCASPSRPLAQRTDGDVDSAIHTSSGQGFHRRGWD